MVKKECVYMYLDDKNPLAPYEMQIDIKDRKQLVAKLLKNWRNAKGYLQKDVAEKIGIPTTTYSGYEIAKTEPPIEVLVRLSYLYDVPVDMLIGRDLFSIDIGEEMQAQIDEVKTALDKIGEEIATGKLKDNEQAQMFADTFLQSLKDLTRAMDETNEIYKGRKK